MLGGILASIFIFVFYIPEEQIISSELEGEVRGMYAELVQLGYSEDVSHEDIKVIVKKVKEASDWVPNGNVEASDVLQGKTFYNNSREVQIGEYVPKEFKFEGNASVEDVLIGEKFYSDSQELLIGTLTLPQVLYKGDASITDVISGKKFYSNSGTLLTGTWSFLGDAGVNEVLEGKKFYSNSGTLLTGTYTPPIPINFTNMQYSTYDDYAGIDSWGWGGVLTEDYKGDESEWVKISNSIWKDKRTGVYWSSDQTISMRTLVPNSNTNTFTAMSLGTCSYFSSIPRSSYDGSDPDCGNAINWCAELTLGERSNWYLPSQKEMLQAYIDGMYNQAGETLTEAAAFTVGEGSSLHYGNYWSSSQASLSNKYAWYVILADGTSYGELKTSTTFGVRCISRD